MPKTILDHADARSTRAALLALPNGKVFLQQGRTRHPSTDKGGTPAGRERALLSLAEALKCPRRKKEWYAHRPFSFRFGSRRPPLKMALRRPSHQNKSSAAALSQSSQCCRSRNHLRNYLISIAPELLTDRYLWVRAATTASENGYRKSAMICRPPSVRDGVSPKVRLYRREKSPIPEAVSKRSGFHGLAGVVGRSCTDHNLIRRMWR